MLIRYIFTFSLFLFVIPQASATEMVGALSAGLGGTGRATVEANESLYLNPATLALLSGFYGGSFWQSGYLAPGLVRKTYGITLSDGTDGIAFPGSLGYRRHHIEQGASDFREDEFKMGLGHRLTEKISVGLAASHLRAKDQLGLSTTQTNFDLGLLVGLRPNWGLAFTAENIVEPKDSIPAALRRNSYLTLGTHYLAAAYLRVQYEALLPIYIDQTQYIAHRLGVALTMTSYFNLNLGYSVDDSRSQNWTSVGLAWRGPRLQFAYAYQTEGRSRLEDRHLVDLWIDF